MEVEKRKEEEGGEAGTAREKKERKRRRDASEMKCSQFFSEQMLV